MSRIFFYLLTVLACINGAHDAWAESIKIDLGNNSLLSGRLIQIFALMTVLAIAPSILIMTTSFTRIIIVMSILRTALGLQQSPPNSVLVGLSLFLTLFIMQPTLEKSYQDGIAPLLEQQMEEIEAFGKIAEPFRLFMVEHTRPKDLQLFTEIANLKVEAKDAPLLTIAPAFMLSELKRAFEIGFLLFLPFLIIDMVVASTLMAMGMMMIPPVMISLPFKLIFFVMIDGWYMICGSLVKSYGVF